jgi:hypothetical protein
MRSFPIKPNVCAAAYVLVYACVNVTVFQLPFRETNPMLTFNTAFAFKSPYIAHPYWPEMFQVIEITKKSGLNRAKSEANRRKALEEYLRSVSMTLTEYEALEARSKQPFHFNPDGYVIIPADKILSFLVAANASARSAYRACPPEQVRSRFVATDFLTTKIQPDGIWRRFSTVSLGTGARASNQRGLRENPYIENFTAEGTISFDETAVKPDTLRNLLEWAGSDVGIGASRKMGKGRFDLTRYEQA